MNPEDRRTAIKQEEDAGRLLETWNTCPDCGAMWKDDIRTPGVLHRTRLCERCKKK